MSTGRPMPGANSIAPLISVALIGHRLSIAFALSMAGRPVRQCLPPMPPYRM